MNYRLLHFIVRNRGTIAFLTACLGGLLACFFWPSSPVIQIKMVDTKPAELFDDTGGQMSCVTLSISNRLSNDTVYLARDDAQAEARVAGAWIRVHEIFLPGELGNQSKEAVLYLPGGADRCRMRLRYAFVSNAWRLGKSLVRHGIKLPPRYWQWAGWPNAKGKHPAWKKFSTEFQLVPIGAFNSDAPHAT